MTSKRLLIHLLGQIAFGMLAMTLCLPSMQDWSRIFNASPAQVQLSFAGYVVAFGAMQLFYGPWSDRWGRKPVLLAGLSLAFIGFVLAALATQLPVLIAARVLQGAGTSAGMVIGRAMVQDVYQGADRTRAMAYIGMAMGVSPPLATWVGGHLHQTLGWQANFVLAACLGGGLMLSAAWGLPAQVASARGSAGLRPHWLADMLRAYRQLFGKPRFVQYVALLAFTYATLYAFFSGVPAVLASYGVGPASMGGYFACMTVSYIAGSFLTSRWVQALGERGVMAWGQASTFTGVGLMLLMALTGQPVVLAVALPLIFIGLGHGLLVPSALAGSVGQIPALAGAAAGMAGLMQQLMGAVGSYAVGLLPHQGSAAMASLMLLFSLLALAMQWLLHRRRDDR